MRSSKNEYLEGQMKDTQSFRDQVVSHLVQHGFIASNRKKPFHSRQGEYFDRPSAVSPYLIECIDVELDGNGYCVSGYFSLTSAYDRPAYLLREMACCLSPNGFGHFIEHTFSVDAVSDLCMAIDHFLLPALHEQADLTYIRDFYLFVGGYKRKGIDFSVFSELGLGPSRHNKRPEILALLEACLGEFKQAVIYLKHHGIPDPVNKHIEVDLDNVPPEEILQLVEQCKNLGPRGHSVFNKVLAEKYGKEKHHWELDLLADLEKGMVKTRSVTDVLQQYRREYIAGYEKIS